MTWATTQAVSTTHLLGKVNFPVLRTGNLIKMEEPRLILGAIPGAPAGNRTAQPECGQNLQSVLHTGQNHVSSLFQFINNSLGITTVTILLGIHLKGIFFLNRCSPERGEKANRPVLSTTHFSPPAISHFTKGMPCFLQLCAVQQELTRCLQ